MKHYDYIICGAGCAGLTFLYKLLAQPHLCNKQILVIDSPSSNVNDKTWCFWESTSSSFEKIINHQWNNLQFISPTFSATLNILPYIYKQIKSIDFCNSILLFAKPFTNVQFSCENIISMQNSTTGVEVTTTQNTYTATYAFNSTFINIDFAKLQSSNFLWQHFKGIEIETNENIFDCHKATFMDFSISQHNGTAFMYVLPTAANRALIEYTLFSKTILHEKEYDSELNNYISQKLKIESYKILHTELGKIPMTDYKFKLHNNNIINIGTVGGCVKGSTGFAFKNIQQQIDNIIELLANSKTPHLKHSFTNKKFLFYDSVLLEVLIQNRISAAKIFSAIFQKNKPQLVLKFLDNKTNIFEDIKIMSSVPIKIFLPVAFKRLFRRKN